MDALILQDTIARGLGRAAVVAGEWFELFRPTGLLAPLAPRHRILKLNALLTPETRELRRSVGYGHPTWSAILDTAYTQPGDYLVSRSGTWFIAAQQPLLPIIAVKTTRRVSFLRPAAPLAAGLNAYGGVTATTLERLTGAWPASVLASGDSGKDAGLPADSAPGAWTVLLPAMRPLVLRNGDLLGDDLGRRGVVASAELTDLGWRLTVRQATT